MPRSNQVLRGVGAGELLRGEVADIGVAQLVKGYTIQPWFLSAIRRVTRAGR